MANDKMVATSKRQVLMKTSFSLSKKNIFAVYFVLPALLLYSVFFILPIADSFRLAFYDSDGLLVKDFVGWDNFVKLFTAYPYRERLFNAFFNNIEFFLIVMVIQNFFGFLLAYMLTRPLRGMATVRKISFLPTTLSIIVVGFLFSKLIFNPVFGVLDATLEMLGLEMLIQSWLGDPGVALKVLAFVIAWQFMGETILFYAAAIDNIPDDIIDAAVVDGANEMQMIWHIVIPYVMPVIGIVTILIFIGDFTQFDIVYSMASTNGNPAYATDLFGSLFYRAAFTTADRGGWGIGMGAAVSTVMSLFVFLGLACWVMFFRTQKKFDY